MSTRHVAIGALVPVLILLLPGTSGAEDLTWNTELGFLTSYHDNYFYRSDDGSTPDETFLIVYGKGEVEFDVGPGELLLFAGASGAFAMDNSDADHQKVNAGIRYKLGKSRARFRYSREIDKVFGEEDTPSLYDTDSFQFRLRHEVIESLLLQGTFEIDVWEFGSSEPGRDALSYEFDAGLRWSVLDWLSLRSSFLWAFKEADDSRFDREGPGFIVGAKFGPWKNASLDLRYRRRWRDYNDAPSGDSNSGREDEIDDVRANLRWQATRIFGLQLNGGYRHGDSTRSDRNYDAAYVTGGIFVTFGNEAD